MTKVVPEIKTTTDEQGESSSMTGKVIIFITVILFIWIAGLLYWVFVVRDTWEVNNLQKITTMTNEIMLLGQANKKEEAVAKYDELLLILGNIKIKNPAISKLISDANAAICDTKKRIDTEKNSVLISDIEKNAKALTSNGQFAEATKKYNEALKIIENCGVNSPELNVIKKRVLDNIQFTEEKERQRQFAELREQQEKMRQIEAKENAKKKMDQIILNLPSLKDVLQKSEISNLKDKVIWSTMITSLEIAKMKSNKKVSLDEYVLSDTEVIKRVKANTSPLITVYRDEILDIIEYIGWSSFGNSDKSDSTYIPLRFAVHQEQLVIIIGSIFSDTVFNNINASLNTPKKRASSFIQKEVLPTLLKTQLPEKLKKARFGYLGILFIYGNSNFVKEDMASPEILAIVMSTHDLIDFVNRDLSQEAFVKKSSVYITSGTLQFIKVEITLE